MRVGFIMDPLESVNVQADTTFAFMLAAAARGDEVHYIQMQGLGAQGAEAFAKTAICQVRQVQGEHFELEAWAWRELGEFDVVFMRKDPPFDVAYLHACHLLELAQRSGVLVVNNPRGLYAANEKLYALHFPELTPATLVTADAQRIRAFMEAQGGRCILKPVDGHGGAGILVLEEQDMNLNSLIELSTKEGREAVMCQAYLPSAREGDKRILMLDGEPMGAILRVPQARDHRGNIHVGGQVERTTLSAADRRIVEAVGPRLREEGLWFVGLDVIGGHLTEVNVTSPTGIQEMSRFDSIDAAHQVMEWAHRKSRSL